MFHKHSSNSSAPQHGEEEESLTTILSTPEQRSELTLLVANCTECMRRTISDAFDPKFTGKPSDQLAIDAQKLSGEDAIKNPNVDPEKVDVEAMDKERKDRERREKELSAPKMKELSDAALQFFDEWRDKVLSRIGEVVNSREQAKEQKKEAQPSTRTSSQPSSDAAQASESTDAEKMDPGVDKSLRELYRPIDTPLVKLEVEKRALVLHAMLLLLLSLEHYSAHSRVLLVYLTTSLDLPISMLSENEEKLAKALLSAADQMNADEHQKKKAEENATTRKWKVGLASVAGAALIGVTGGLAAPLLAAGVGSVMGGLGLGATAAAGYLGTLASSGVIVGGLFGAYGGRMTGQMMDQYAKEVSDFAFIPVREFHHPRKIEKEYRRLRVAIGISGWLESEEEVVKPWCVVAPSIEAFALRWELETLLNLGHGLSSMVKSFAWGYAKKEIISHTVFGALTAAMWPIALLKVGKVVDNPFSVAKSRSEKAGEVLADAIINKAQGERPVSLVGYSLGARVIYTCLMRLAERKAFGLVESVVLLGAPTPSTAGDWRRMRAVVTGRLVNVYSENDFILGYLYRTSAIQYGVAGLQKVEGVKGVENVDMSDLIDGHQRYRYLNGHILKRIGFEDISVKEVEREEAELREREKKEKEEEVKNAEKHEDADKEAEKMEKEVEKKNQESFMDKAGEKLSLDKAKAAIGK